MNRKVNIKAIMLSVAAAASAFPAASQLHESISVDGRYVPDVIRIDRINAFPKALKATLTSSPLNYESRGIAASFNPSLVILPATGWRADREISTNRGYLELGAGSWLNSTLSAGYRFIDNSTTLFGVRLQHNSTSLWKPEMSELTAETKQYRYDESVGLYASQVVKGYGRLDAALDYHFGRFNYYGFGGCLTPSSAAPEAMDEVPSQTLNDVAFRVDWRSLVSASTSMLWNATARLRHFGYKDFPQHPSFLSGHPILDSYPSHLPTRKGSRETNIGLQGGVCMPWDSGSSIGVDADLDVMVLSNTDLDNYAMFTLTPYYRFSKGLLDIRLGADVDFTFKAGEEGERYSFVHVAPDVRFGVQTGQVGVYLDLLGGSELTTLARLHQLDYYGMPYLVSTRPTFSPLDAAFGVNLGPFSGFSLGVKARYKAVKNIPLGGWYMAWLNYGDILLDGMEPQLPDHAAIDYSSAMAKGINLHGVSLSGRMAYEYGDIFSISAEGSYQPQDGEKGFFNGYDRAKLTASAKMSVRPVKPFKVGVSYDYRGKRAIYTSSGLDLNALLQSTVIINGVSSAYHYLHLPDLTLLNLSASWDFSPNFTLWLQADNLLNRHDEVLPMQPTQGLVLAGGFKWLF